MESQSRHEGRYSYDVVIIGGVRWAMPRRARPERMTPMWRLSHCHPILAEIITYPAESIVDQLRVQ